MDFVSHLFFLDMAVFHIVSLLLLFCWLLISALLFDSCLFLTDDKVISLLFALCYQMDDCVDYLSTNDANESKQQTHA